MGYLLPIRGFFLNKLRIMQDILTLVSMGAVWDLRNNSNKRGFRIIRDSNYRGFTALRKGRYSDKQTTRLPFTALM